MHTVAVVKIFFIIKRSVAYLGWLFLLEEILNLRKKTKLRSKYSLDLMASLLIIYLKKKQ